MERKLCESATGVCACFAFRKASRAVTQLYDDSLSEAGLRSTQFVVLATVNVEGPVMLSDLAKILVMDRTTLTRNLKPLTEAGYLRTKSAADRRTRLVSLTAKGQRVVSKAIPLWKSAQKRFVKEFGPKKWDGFLDGLEGAVEAAQIA